jgi:RimJ/RimL family protein N-acetyltransferase
LRHDAHIAGYAFGLRPVAESDAAYIVDLRSRAGKYLNRAANTIERQTTWLHAYFARADDYYFVVETIDGRHREGLIGIYDVRLGVAGEWGRWVIEPASNSAVESALLLYRFAFEELSLEQVCCRTLCTNAKVVAFHDSCGLARAPDAVTIDHDLLPARAIEHRLHRAEWPKVMLRLDRLASRFAATATRSHVRAAPP